MDIVIVAALAIVSLLIGLSKGGLGGPIPVAMGVPILVAMGVPVADAVALTLPLLIFADMFALRFYWGDWEMQYIRLMLPVGVVGVLIGTWMLASLDDQILRPIMGAFTLAAVIYKLISDSMKQIEYTPRPWHGYLAGLASGAGSAVGNLGAPPFTAYMLLQKVTPTTFVGTTTLMFAIINLAKVPGFYTSGILTIETMWKILWAMPIIPAGVWLGRFIIKRINAQTFERLMIVLLALMGLWLLLGQVR